MADQERMNPLKEEREVLAEYRRRKHAERIRLDGRRHETSNQYPERGSLVDKELQRLARETNLGKTGEPPFFGRLDFHDSIDDRRFTVYLGVAFDEQNVKIVDWRRPIAELFYPPFPRSIEIYQRPNRTVLKNLGRRHLDYKGIEINSLLDSIDRKEAVVFTDENSPWDLGKSPNVQEVEENETSFDSGKNVSSRRRGEDNRQSETNTVICNPFRQILLRRLEQRTAGKEFIPFIESLVEEQFKIIAGVSENRILIVSGPAGSGKTGCALMRAATLHFRRRKPDEFELRGFERSGPLNVALVAKKNELLQYVHGVLPALGESAAVRFSFESLQASMIALVRRIVKKTTGVKVDSSALRALRREEIYVGADLVKGHFENALRNGRFSVKRRHIVLGLNSSIEGMVRYTDQISLLKESSFESERLKKFRIERKVSVSTNCSPNTRNEVGQRSFKTIVDTRDWVIPLISANDRSATFNRLLLELDRHWHGLILGIADKMPPRVASLVLENVKSALHEWFEYVIRDWETNHDLFLPELAEYADASEKNSQEQTVLRRVSRVLNRGFNPNDLTSLAVWYTVVSEILNERVSGIDGVNHVVIDEAHEFSREELILLDCAFGPECRYAICGDLNQRLNSNGITNWRQLEHIFSGGVEHKELRTNYRSSQQINSVARAILPVLDSRPSPRMGPPVQLHRIEGKNRAESTQYLAKLIEMMERDKVGRTGVLWTAQQPPFQKLSLTKLVPMEVARKERGKADLIGGRMDELGGLEYDAAILVVGEMIDDQETRRSLYVAITRARTHLHIVCTRGTPAWFIELMPTLVKVVRP